MYPLASDSRLVVETRDSRSKLSATCFTIHFSVRFTCILPCGSNSVGRVPAFQAGTFCSRLRPPAPGTKLPVEGRDSPFLLHPGNGRCFISSKPPYFWPLVALLKRGHGNHQRPFYLNMHIVPLSWLDRTARRF